MAVVLMHVTHGARVAVKTCAIRREGVEFSQERAKNELFRIGKDAPKISLAEKKSSSFTLQGCQETSAGDRRTARANYKNNDHRLIYA